MLGCRQVQILRWTAQLGKSEDEVSPGLTTLVTSASKRGMTNPMFNTNYLCFVSCNMRVLFTLIAAKV